MDSYDLVMLGILVLATLFGAFKGFAWQVASLASLVASYFVAYKFRDVITPMIATSPPWNTFMAMLAVYSGTSLVIWAGFRVVADFLDKMRLKNFDRQMGALLGFGKGVLFCTVVTFFAVTLLGESVRRDIVRSRSGHYISQLLNDADPIMPGEIKSVLGPYLEELDERLDPDGMPLGGREDRDEELDGDAPANGSRRPSGDAWGGTNANREPMANQFNRSPQNSGRQTPRR